MEAGRTARASPSEDEDSKNTPFDVKDFAGDRDLRVRTRAADPGSMLVNHFDIRL